MKSKKMAKALSPLLALAMVLSLMAAVLFTTAAPVSASPDVIHVHAGESIQDAINNATAGDTIIVHDGEYEGFTVNKTLTIRSDNGTANTTINSTVYIELGWDDAANPMAEQLVLGGSGVGFTINSMVVDGEDGIETIVKHGSSLTIEGNIIRNHLAGIDVEEVGADSYLAILDNEIYGNNGPGIDIDVIYTSEVLIQGNDIYENAVVDTGIWINTVSRFSYLSIIDNEITNNTGDGIYIYEIYYFSQATIAGNNITNNTANGIYVEYVIYNGYLDISDNTVMGNNANGIYLYEIYYGGRAVIGGQPNIISENGDDGIEIEHVYDGSYLAILDNEIINNTGDGIHFDSDIWDGSEVIFHNNDIINNTGDGIQVNGVYTGSRVNITANQITGNGDDDDDGIYIYGIYENGEVVIGGQKNTISDNGRDGIHIEDCVYDASRLAILDNDIINNGDDGIYINYIDEAREVVIHNNNISGNPDDGIDIYEVEESSYLAITANDIINNTDSGIEIEGIDEGSEVIIGGEGNDISDNGGYGIYIGEGEDYVSVDYGAYLAILDNDIINNGYGGICIDRGIDEGSEVVIENNIISGNGYGGKSDGIYVAYLDWGSYLAILANEITNNNGDGIYIYDIYDGSEGLIQGNIISENDYGIYISDYVYDGSYLAILDNEISNNAEDGIYIYEIEAGSYVLIQNNNAISGNNGTGVYIPYMGSGTKLALINNLIEDNNATGIGWGGVYVAQIYDGCEVWVLSNTIEDNDGVGLWLDEIADSKVTIKGNTIMLNTADGIRLWALHTEVTIWSNDILCNEQWGIRVDGTAALVTAHENNIMGNTNGTSNENPTDASFEVDATYNWWGAASGPSGAGNGTGDSVSANVTYKPFRDTGSVTIMPTVRALFNFEVPGIVDATADTDTLVTFSDTGYVSGFICIDKYSATSTEKKEFTDDTGRTALKFIVVQVFDFDTGTAHIELHYTGTGEILPCSLDLYYWNGDEWVKCANSGVDTNNRIVYGDIPVSALYAEDPPVAAGGLGLPSLEVDIITPPDGSTFSTYQDFTVNAIVTNTGETDAEDVTATIAIDPSDTASLQPGENATKPIGVIYSGESREVSWDLHCDGAGESIITVTANGTDECGGDIGDVVSDSVGIQQENKTHLVVHITSPVDGTSFNTDQAFMVNATVTNTGAATATEVTATIDPGDTASLAIGEPATKATTPATIPSGGSGTVSWILHCDSVGDSIITVTANGTDDNTGSAIPVANIVPDSVTVHQQTKAHLVVNINCPLDGTNIETCQDFTVYVTVNNTGGATATGVTATIDPGDTASLAVGEPVTKATEPATIPGGGSGTVSWILHCDSAGDSVITVTANGTDANTGAAIAAANIAPDSVTVHQQEEPGPGLSGGAIAGIAIGVAVVAFLLGFLAARWWKKEEESKAES